MINQSATANTVGQTLHVRLAQSGHRGQRSADILSVTSGSAVTVYTRGPCRIYYSWHFMVFLLSPDLYRGWNNAGWCRKWVSMQELRQAHKRVCSGSAGPARSN